MPALREAIAVFRAVGDVRGETSAIINRAIVERRRGRLAAPARPASKPSGCASCSSHAEGQVDCLDVVAAIDVAEARYAEGLRLFVIVDAARRRLGLEVATPDERHDRDAAIALARVTLDGASIAAIELANATADIATTAIEAPRRRLSLSRASSSEASQASRSSGLGAERSRRGGLSPPTGW